VIFSGVASAILADIESRGFQPGGSVARTDHGGIFPPFDPRGRMHALRQARMPAATLKPRCFN